MSRPGIHYRLIARSPELQRVVDVLKNAGAPISSLEIQERIRELYQKPALNISTCITEIRSNEGYSITKASRKIDGTYRYILLRAPGWIPTWQAEDTTEEDKVTRGQGDKETEPEEIDRPPRFCKLERCIKEIPESGPPFCCIEHRDEFFGVKADVCQG